MIWPPADTTLVSLRGQVFATETGMDAKYMALIVENPDDSVTAQWQVYWQQAWASERTGGTSGDYTAEKGLRNTGFVRTDLNAAVSGDIAWGVNSLSVKAVGRLQIPNLNPLRTTNREVNVGWKNPYDTTDEYDLSDGEVYWDAIQKGIVARMADGWYMVHQPERIKSSGFPAFSFTWTAGTEKNLVYTGSSPYAITLETDRDNVVPGTVVRIMYRPSSGSSNMSVSFGGTAALVLTPGQAAEFVFYDSGSSGEWLVTQANVTTVA